MQEHARDVAAYLGQIGEELRLALPYLTLIALWYFIIVMALYSFSYYFSTAPVVINDEGINTKRAAFAKPASSRSPPPIGESVSPLTLESIDAQRASELTAAESQPRPIRVERQQVEAAAALRPDAHERQDTQLLAAVTKCKKGGIIPESEWGK
jgi:hypothetical protein